MASAAPLGRFRFPGCVIMEPSLVLPGLWVGGVASLAQIPALGITHVVSVINSPEALSHPYLPTVTGRRHLVDVEDAEEADLLALLPAAVGYVQQALAAGGHVLVHCAAGVSRSPAVVVAYMMACEPGLLPAQALARLKLAHAPAAPNEGFMQQLELFQAMGCRLDDSHLPYRRHLLQRVGRQYEETGTLDATTLAQPTEEGAGLATLYRCRKCRTLLATSRNVVEVEQGPGASAFPWRKRDKQQRQLNTAGGRPDDSTVGSSRAEEDGGSLFVEPLRWMASMVVGGPVQGKLYCPRCQARLGSFNWSGAQSSSGAWVVPSFQLHTARLDAVDPRPPAALSAIRQPRMLPGSTARQQAVPEAVPADGASQHLAGTAAASEAGAGSSTGVKVASEGGECPGGGCCPPAEALAQQLQQGVVLGGDVPSSPAAAVAATAAGSCAKGGQEAQNSGGAPRRFTHLILDCDGVMVDSERASCEALRRSILQVTGVDIPHDFPHDFRPVFGMDVRSCIEYYKQSLGRSDWADPATLAAEVMEAKEGIYQQLTEGGVPAFEGVADLIHAALQQGLGVAVASSGSPDKIRHNLSSSGLWGLVDEHLVVSAKYVARGKPAPDVYLEALRRLGCQDASRALVVEDAINGLTAAHKAGCFTVAITNSLPHELLEPHADVVVALIGEVQRLLVQEGAS